MAPQYCYFANWQTGATDCSGINSLSIISNPAVTYVQLPASSQTGQSTTYTFGYYYTQALQDSGLLSWGEVHSIGMCTGGCASGLGLGQVQPLCTNGAPNCAQWNVTYNYLFDQVSTSNYLPNVARPAGTTLNPVLSRVMYYNELRDGSGATLRTEPRTYCYSFYQNQSGTPCYNATQGQTSVYSSPTVGITAVTYPDGSTSSIVTTALCSTSRDYCPAVPYKTVNRDGSYTKLGWSFPVSSNSFSTPFNPYAAYSVLYPVSADALASATQTQQDANGNITLLSEYTWLQNPPTMNGLFVSGLSDTPIRTAVTNYSWSSPLGGYPYYDERSAGTTYLSAKTCMSMSAGNVSSGSNGPSCVAGGSCVFGNNTPNNTVNELYTYDNPLTTANLTTLQQWDCASSSSGAYINTNWTYQGGNVVKYIDANSNSTLITYDSYQYPLTVKVAANTGVQRSFGYTYDSSSGLVHIRTDNDNSITATYTYDNLGRTTSVSEAASSLSRSITTTYDDVNIGVTVTDPDTSTTTYYDALGRIRYAQNQAAGINVQKAYRYGSGVSYELSSNPYTTTGDTTMGWTLTTRDPMGRTMEVDNYMGSNLPQTGWLGGNTTTTGTAAAAYQGPTSPCTGFNVKLTDQASNVHLNCLDGLGRLIAVQEPQTSSTSSSVVTNYGYDILNNVTGVNSMIGSSSGQTYSGCSGGLVRCFSYSSLSRLVWANNPESGLTSYFYDTNGNLRSRTDANGRVMSIGAYDGLNRPPGLSYSNDPAQTSAVAYTYDQDFHGALSSVANGYSSTSYSHDPLGRVTGSQQITNRVTYSPFSYTYSLADQLTSITYPSGRTITYNLDSADRVTSVIGSFNGQPTSYASGITYTAAGGISTQTMGNGLTSTLSWNDRLQITGVKIKNSGSNVVLGLNLYPCLPPATTCSTTASGGNNGNLIAQTISADAYTLPNGTQVPAVGPLTQTYTYDAVNRLTGICESASQTCPGSSQLEQYSYDGFGNRWVSQHNTSLPSSVETPTANVYTTSVPNQINGFTYDNAGNILSVPLAPPTYYRNFSYDAENRQILATLTGTGGVQATYAYDGNGLRVSKTVTETTTYYVYDAFGNLAAEYGPPEPSPCSAGAGTCFVTPDHLGSTRLLTDVSGTAQRRYDFLPFGTEIPSGVNGRSTTMGYQTTPDDANPKFTGQMRDAETRSLASSLDWFNVRHMSGGQGRFQSPDPANAGAVLGNPQSWNGYAYVVNNPMSYVDPSGLYCLYPNGGTNPYGGAIAPNTYDGTIDMGGCNATGGTWYNNPTTTVTVNGNDDGDNGGTAGFDMTVVDVTSGGSAVKGSIHFSIGSPTSSCNDPKAGWNRSRFFQYLPGLLWVSQQLNVPSNYIVGLSSMESGWLDNHNLALNNLWGLTKGGGNNIPFSSMASGNQYFSQHVGPYIQNAQTVPQFFSGLNREGYNSDNPDYFNTNPAKGVLANRISNIQKWATTCGVSF